ncbi:MAG: hypothetical protein K2O12_02565, partial [Muribaculaceae bacterium]|nr:hypothetical protein [Muribaculaceae bacterium]
MKKLVLSVLALTTVSGIYAQKLSPNAEALLMGKNGNKATTLLSKGIKTDIETVKVFIDLYDENAIAQIEKLGGKVYLGFDNCITAEIPVSSLREVSELDDVRYVEMGAPVHLCMDVARNATKVD